MALIPCPECGRQISTSASGCPTCGCPAGRAQPTQETQRPRLAEPKSETESAALDPQLVEQLKTLVPKFNGHNLIVDDDAIQNLPAIVRLCSGVAPSIFITGVGWRDRHIEQLQQIPNLRHLVVDVTGHLTDLSLVHISNLQSLTRLELRGVFSDHHLTEFAYGQLTRLRNLQVFVVPWKTPPGLVAKLQQAMPNVNVL